MKNVPIGQVLKEYGYITDAQIQQALAYQRENRDKRLRMGEIFIELGFITERQMLEALGQRLSLPLVDVGTCNFDIAAVERIPRQMAVNNSIIAFAVTDNSLKVITSDPMNLYGLSLIHI